MMSISIRVPAAVPSLTHSSRACSASLAAKNSRPFATTSGDADVWTSGFSFVVPAAVPSVRHSPTPEWSLAKKYANCPIRTVPPRPPRIGARLGVRDAKGARGRAVGPPQFLPVRGVIPRFRLTPPRTCC